MSNAYVRALNELKVPFTTRPIFSQFHGTLYLFEAKYLRKVDAKFKQFCKHSVYRNETVNGVKMKGFTLFN